jgi:hypothetical protein
MVGNHPFIGMLVRFVSVADVLLIEDLCLPELLLMQAVSIHD